MEKKLEMQETIVQVLSSEESAAVIGGGVIMTLPDPKMVSYLIGISSSTIAGTGLGGTLINPQ